MVPVKPDAFTPDGAPVGVEVRFVTFWQDRPLITPRSLFVHTNAARGEGDVDSAWNWSHAKPGSNTLPHYQVDRDGRARKMLPTNRRGIANATVTRPGPAGTKAQWDRWNALTPEQQAESDAHGNIAGWSLAVETADTGTDDDPAISAFTGAQVEVLAAILAYESIAHSIPLAVPADWWGPGTATHTWPHDYPWTTLYRGKTCPGDKKKAQFRDVLLPLALGVRDAWLAPVPLPPQEADVLYLARSLDNPYHYRRGDGNVATQLRSREYRHLIELYGLGRAPEYRHPITREAIGAWDQVPVLNETELDLWVGYVDGNSLADEG